MQHVREQSGLEVVESYLYPHEADLAKSLLDGEGIQAWLFDDQQIRMRWHLSAALGGVKLVVRPADAMRARELLASDRSHMLAEIPEQHLPAAPEELCPQCTSDAVQTTRSAEVATVPQWLQALLFLVSFGILVPRRPNRRDCRCEQCGHEWMVVKGH